MVINKEAEERRFDSFCRKVIVNEAKDAYREAARREKREVSLTGMTDEQVNHFCTEDTYRTYERIYYVCDIPVAVHDEDLGEVLGFLVPSIRNVILLSFIQEMKDTEIAKLLHISASTVGNRRKVALVRIREELEAMKNVRYKD